MKNIFVVVASFSLIFSSFLACSASAQQPKTPAKAPAATQPKAPAKAQPAAPPATVYLQYPSTFGPNDTAQRKDALNKIIKILRLDHFEDSPNRPADDPNRPVRHATKANRKELHNFLLNTYLPWFTQKAYYDDFQELRYVFQHKSGDQRFLYGIKQSEPYHYLIDKMYQYFSCIVAQKPIEVDGQRFRPILPAQRPANPVYRYDHIVRQNAVLMLGLLNMSSEKAVKEQPPALPLYRKEFFATKMKPQPLVMPMLGNIVLHKDAGLKAMKVPRFDDAAVPAAFRITDAMEIPDNLKVAAMEGIVRHCKINGVENKHFSTLNQLLLGLIQQKTPPPGRDPTAHDWIRTQAAEALYYLAFNYPVDYQSRLVSMLIPAARLETNQAVKAYTEYRKTGKPKDGIVANQKTDLAHRILAILGTVTLKEKAVPEAEAKQFIQVALDLAIIQAMMEINAGPTGFHRGRYYERVNLLDIALRDPKASSTSTVKVGGQSIVSGYSALAGVYENLAEYAKDGVSDCRRPTDPASRVFNDIGKQLQTLSAMRQQL